MKAKDLFIKGVKYNREEVQKILRDNGKKQVSLWLNIRGWSAYYTTEPTIATPAGKSLKVIKA